MESREGFAERGNSGSECMMSVSRHLVITIVIIDVVVDVVVVVKQNVGG